MGPRRHRPSLGYPEVHDPPYSAEVEAARRTIRKACRNDKIAFLDVMTDANVDERIAEGVRVVATRPEQAAARGRRLTGRPRPW